MKKSSLSHLIVHLFVVFFIISSFSSLYADITLHGYLHPGDNDDTQYIPKDPLTNNEEHTYDYYLNNPTKFYLSQDCDITAVELVNAAGIDSAIRVYIDGNLVGTGASGSATIALDTTLSLASGYHDIAVRGSCYNRFGNETTCGSRFVRDIDDFNFSALKLISGQTTTAVDFMQRVHLGDYTDSDDNYDIDDTSNSFYPDAPEATSKVYLLDGNITGNLAAFRIFISRMRDVSVDGINKIKVYDSTNALITTFDINQSTDYKFDVSKLYVGNVNGISKVEILCGHISSSNDDDISFGELIVIPYTSVADIYPKPIINYRMDECSWDSDINTYEIKNYGTLGDDYNATALNDANVTDGKIYTGGDINATTSSDKAILVQNNISLPTNYTLTTWVKFPLNENGHTTFQEGWGWNRRSIKYFNIADRPGSSNDYIYFQYDTTNNSWNLCMQGNTYECQNYNPQNLSGWHLLSFVVNGDDGTAKFYVDTTETLNFSQAPSGALGLLFNSDYQSNNDNEPNGQSIGAVVDEFKIFNRLLAQSEIQTLYNNENSANNYDGTTREIPQCGGNIQENKTTLFNAVSSINGATCNAIDDWNNNLTTQIVNQPYGLYILSQDEFNQSSEANITKVILKYYDDGNTTDCSGNLLESAIQCDDTTSTTCNDTNANGCAYYAITTNRAVKCVQVYIEGRDKNNSSSDINSSYSSDNYAVRPSKFSVEFPVTTLYAGEDFNISFSALDKNDNNTANYNETKDTSFEVNATEIKTGCKTGDFNLNAFNFTDGNASDINATYSEVGEVNITIKEINGSEFAKVDSDDTNDSTRFIESNSTTITIKPYDINITKVDFNVSTNQNWLYMADNINDMNITLHVEVGAFNKQGDYLQDFNSSCYAKDINLTFHYNTDTSRDLNLTLDGNLTDSNNSIKDINKTLQFPKSLFVSGDANSSYAFGIDRDRAKPKNPLLVKLKDVNITTSGLAKNENNISKDDNASFYYGRVKTRDITTNEKTVTNTISVQIYDTNSNDDFHQDFYQDSLNWYRMKDDNITRIKELVPQISFTYDSDNNKSGLGIDKNSSVPIANGVADINLTNSWDSSDSAYIHIKIPNYLWYNLYSDYNESNGSDYSQHPYFKYNCMKRNSNQGIESGAFSGSDIGSDYNATKTKKGVKVFR